MSLTITGVSAVAATDFPLPASPTELQVLDFAAILQNSPMSGMPQLANPAALASELFNHLRGFVERANHYGNLSSEIPQLSPGVATDGQNVMLASADGNRLTNLPGGGPARDNAALAGLAHPGAEGEAATLSPEQASSLADLQRTMEFCLAVLNFSVEATVVGGGVTQGVHSINTLLRAE